MASMSAIREGLATNLRTISGLRADVVPAGINPPVAVVGFPEDIDFDLTYGRGADTWTIPIQVLVSRASERAGGDLLETYLDSTGASSVKTAIESDPDLGGVVDSIRVVRARRPGKYVIDDVEYLGVEFVVEVIA